MPLVINSPRGGHTHTHTDSQTEAIIRNQGGHTHTYRFKDRSNHKKPGAHRPHMPGLKLIMYWDKLIAICVIICIPDLSPITVLVSVTV